MINDRKARPRAWLFLCLGQGKELQVELAFIKATERCPNLYSIHYKFHQYCGKKECEGLMNIWYNRK
ncbi:hypothetical protein BU202_03460 [Streptococcus cuniculi]|uniref:Uncharacterized protein n=1 Tax=Streptococcus cuniculi TaxID=1432788 RepID=A0A1Q8E8E6_9STRE|nr:hypothetical protein BU202_03460 [Streptococcus cuniculi]